VRTRSRDPGRRRPWTRWVGLGVGLALAAVVVVAGRVPRGTGELGADVRIVTMADPKLDLSPVGLVLSGIALHPSGEDGGAHGTLRVRNATGKPMQVRLGGKVSRGELSALLWLRVVAPGNDSPLFRGPATRLQAVSASPFTLQPGQDTTLSFTAWVPESSFGGFEAGEAEIGLEWQVSPR
jgi:hypothetical protein